MKSNHNKFVQTRVISMQLFFIQMIAKLEGYQDMFPVIEHLIKYRNQILKDYHLLKFDKKIITITSLEDLEYEFSRNVTYYLAEQEAATYIFNALKSLSYEDELVDSIDALIIFLSEHHRGIYQYMAGKVYLDELDEYFNPIYFPDDSVALESKDDKTYIIDENHPQLYFNKEANEVVAEIVGDLIIEENCKIDINYNKLDDGLIYNDRLVFSGKVEIKGDFNARDYYVEKEEDFKCTGDVSAFMFQSKGSIHIDGNIEIMSIFSVDKNLFVGSDLRADKICVGNDLIVKGDVDTHESIDTSNGKIVMGSINIENPEL